MPIFIWFAYWAFVSKSCFKKGFQYLKNSKFESYSSNLTMLSKRSKKLRPREAKFRQKWTEEPGLSTYIHLHSCFNCPWTWQAADLGFMKYPICLPQPSFLLVRKWSNSFQFGAWLRYLYSPPCWLRFPVHGRWPIQQQTCQTLSYLRILCLSIQRKSASTLVVLETGKTPTSTWDVTDCNKLNAPCTVCPDSMLLMMLIRNFGRQNSDTQEKHQNILQPPHVDWGLHHDL